MEFLLPLHPRLVHFPIALSLVGAAFVALGLWRRHARWLEYGRLSLGLGWVGVLVAAGAGLIDQSAYSLTTDAAALLNQHITVGILLIVVLGLALYWPLRHRNLWTVPSQRRVFYLLLAGAVALVLVEAWLGGKLVYDLGVGVAGPRP